MYRGASETGLGKSITSARFTYEMIKMKEMIGKFYIDKNIVNRNNKNKEYYDQYIAEIMVWLYDNPNKEVEDNILYGIIDGEIDLIHLVKCYKAYKYVDRILFRLSLTDNSYIYKIINYMSYEPDLRTYLTDIKDSIRNKEELENYIIDNSGSYGIRKLVVIYDVLGFNINRVLSIIKNRNPDIYDKIISDQV